MSREYAASELLQPASDAAERDRKRDRTPHLKDPSRASVSTKDHGLPNSPPTASDLGISIQASPPPSSMVPAVDIQFDTRTILVRGDRAWHINLIRSTARWCSFLSPPSRSRGN